MTGNQVVGRRWSVSRGTASMRVPKGISGEIRALERSLPLLGHAGRARGLMNDRPRMTLDGWLALEGRPDGPVWIGG
jgi:hypothetical protein